MIGFPVPTGVPVQPPENHSQVAPAPKLPPLAVKVVLEPAHTVLFDADTDPGARLRALTVIAVETQAVLPQEPSARR